MGKVMSRNLSYILKEPVITEKSTALSTHGKYTFQVDKSATKFLIKKAFEQIFPDRKVLSVQTLTQSGHAKRTKSGIKLPRSSKKAVITASGPRIDYFPEAS